MGERYGKTPAELVRVSLADFEVNLAVYLFTGGERGHAHAWDVRNAQSQAQARAQQR